MSEEEQNMNNLFLNRRLNELAAMLKEHRMGTLRTFTKIKARFCLQEGVSYKTAGTYVKILKDSGLLTMYDGKKGWKYNPSEEWDLFHVSVLYGHDNRGEKKE